jgi:hypothetical protein
MGSGSSSLSCGVFLPLLLLQAFPAPDCWVCATSPAFSGWIVRDFPSPLFGAQGAPPSMPHVFIVLIAYYSVSLFSLGGGQPVQGAMVIWPRVVCGSTVYYLAHLVVCVFSSHLGAGIWWQCRSLPGLSVLCEVEMLCTGWRCGAVTVLPILGGFSCKVVSSVSTRFYFRRHTFCFLPLVTSWNLQEGKI